MQQTQSSGPVAQWIEQLPSKQLVVGSIPARATIFTLKMPHRGFVTETHIDFSLEISGN